METPRHADAVDPHVGDSPDCPRAPRALSDPLASLVLPQEPDPMKSEYRTGYLAALEFVHDRYEFGPDRTIEAFDTWLHERIIESRQGVTGDGPASALRSGSRRCDVSSPNAGEEPAPDSISASQGPETP